MARDAVALAAAVRAGELAASEVIADALDAARRDAQLGAFWCLAEGRALERAAEIDRAGAAAAQPLAGVPFAVKDSFDVAGLPTSGGIRAGLRTRPRSDATAVRRLEAAGAVAIGKTAMDPLAWTTHGQAEGFPPCLNPRDAALSPGGSSAGSAVAVGAGIVPLALGSDTAGSVRIPAAYCGVVGLKPASGAISLEGCLPLSATCDTAGVLSSSVRGCAAACDALIGGSDATSALHQAERPAPRVGILADLLEAAEPAVAAVCSEALGRLEASGATLEEVRLGWPAPGLGLLLAVELAAAWGEQVRAKPDRFPPAIASAIERASTVPRARYEEVLGGVQAARRELGGRLGGLDALVSPTVPVPVPALDEEDVAVSTRFTRIFNALGWPAISVPCGRDGHGRPVGLQVAAVRSLEQVLTVAVAVEAGALEAAPRTAS